MPNQDISLTTYDPQAAAIQRQQQLAQLLQDQSQQPLQPLAPNAPISPFSALAKMLRAYESRKMSEKAISDTEALQTERSQKMADLLKGYNQPYKTTDTSPTADAASTASAQDTGEPLQQYKTAQPTPEQNLAQAMAIANTRAPGSDVMGGALTKDALTQMESARTLQRLGPYYQSVIAAAPEPVRPMLSSALQNGDLKTLDTYAAQLPGKMTPAAVNQAVPVTLEQAGIDPKTVPPGTKVFKKPDGTYDVQKPSDMMSEGRFGQQTKLAQTRANIQTQALKDRNTVSDEDAPLLDTAVISGRLDPNRINSRTAKIYGQILKIDPTADFVTPAGIARMKQNPQVQMKVMTAATIPQMLTNLKNVVGQLNYSDLKAAGGIKKWWLGQTNDPTLAKYGPVRNDLILKITSAMRGIGMSDKATELEDKVNSETMSSAAIKGYIEGQMEGLRPMLQMYEGIALRTPGMNPTGLPVAAGTVMPDETAAAPAQPGTKQPTTSNW